MTKSSNGRTAGNQNLFRGSQPSAGNAAKNEVYEDLLHQIHVSDGAVASLVSLSSHILSTKVQTQSVGYYCQSNIRQNSDSHYSISLVDLYDNDTLFPNSFQARADSLGLALATSNTAPNMTRNSQQYLNLCHISEILRRNEGCTAINVSAGLSNYTVAEVCVDKVKQSLVASGLSDVEVEMKRGQLILCGNRVKFVNCAQINKV